MKYTPTVEKSVCQAKADEVFDRLPKLIADATQYIDHEEVEEAFYILKRWADFCDRAGLLVRDMPDFEKASFANDNMRSEGAQSAFNDIQVRAQELEKQTRHKLPEDLQEEMSAIHLLAAEAGTGCGYILMSGGNK